MLFTAVSLLWLQMPATVEILQALPELRHPAECGSGEAKFSMLPFHIFWQIGNVCCQWARVCTNNILIFGLRVCFWRKERCSERQALRKGFGAGLFTYLFYLFMAWFRCWFCCGNAWPQWQVNKKTLERQPRSESFSVTAFPQSWARPACARGDAAQWAVWAFFCRWSCYVEDLTDHIICQHSLIHIPGCSQKAACPWGLPGRLVIHRNT